MRTRDTLSDTPLTYTTHTRVGGGVASGWVLVDVNRLGYDGWWPVLVDADAESDLI